MATATSKQGAGTQPGFESPEGDPRVVLPGLGWKGSKTMPRLRGDRTRPRMIDLDGDLILWSPASVHERARDRLSWFAHAIVEEFRIGCATSGQTTFRRRTKGGSVEGDLSDVLSRAPAKSATRQSRSLMERIICRS